MVICFSCLVCYIQIQYLLASFVHMVPSGISWYVKYMISYKNVYSHKCIPNFVIVVKRFFIIKTFGANISAHTSYIGHKLHFCLTISFVMHRVILQLNYLVLLPLFLPLIFGFADVYLPFFTFFKIFIIQ